MFTEDDLREALHHSAARADTLLAERPADVPVAPQAVRRRRWATPLAAAACVLAVAGSAVALSRAAEDRPRMDPGHSSTAPLPRQTPVDTSAVVALAGSDVSRVVDDLTSGSSKTQHLYRFLPHNRRIDVFIPSATPLSLAVALSRSRNVTTGGVTGAYSRFPGLPFHGPGDRARTPAWTLAIGQQADPALVQTEVFVQLSASTNHGLIYSSVDDLPAVVEAYRDLKLRRGTAAATVGLRTGYLPAGMSVTYLHATRAGQTLAFLHDKRGRGVQIDVVPAAAVVGPGSCVAGCPTVVHRVQDQMQIMVSSADFPKAVLQRVANTLTVRHDPSKWFTVAQAFGR